jgi:hypothetical protein
MTKAKKVKIEKRTQTTLCQFASIDVHSWFQRTLILAGTPLLFLVALRKERPESTKAQPKKRTQFSLSRFVFTGVHSWLPIFYLSSARPKNMHRKNEPNFPATSIHQQSAQCLGGKDSTSSFPLVQFRRLHVGASVRSSVPCQEFPTFTCWLSPSSVRKACNRKNEPNLRATCLQQPSTFIISSGSAGSCPLVVSKNLRLCAKNASSL